MTKAAELAKMGEVLDNSQIGRKNIIINGAMQLAQRGTSSSGLGATTAGYTTVDRYAAYAGADATAGRYTMSQSTVTDLEGFSNALKIDCTTADTSIAAGEALLIQHPVEGFNVQQLKATSTTTRAFTLSFYAKSNASRAIATEINLTNGTNRSASKLHTIGTSWARYTFTVPAASSTQIDNDNSSSQATPFEHRSFGEELGLCQRYYYQHVMGGTSGPRAQQYHANYKLYDDWFPVTMRAAPTGTVTVNNGSPTAFSTGRNRWQAYQASDYDGTTIYMMTSAVYDAEL